MASEVSRFVDIDSNERLKLARAYTFAACIGQLVENAAAVMNEFNATLFIIRVLTGVTGQICNPLRPVDSPAVNDVSIIKSDALKVIDNGRGFLFRQIRVMLRAGFRQAHVFTKLFGKRTAKLALFASCHLPRLADITQQLCSCRGQQPRAEAALLKAKSSLGFAVFEKQR